MKSLTVARTVADLRRAVGEFRSAGRTIGMIPTMGALHDGHVSLVQGALDRGDVPVASIFVNPTQFGPNEDFSAYPRDEAGDFARLEAAHCRIVYAPSKEEMYPGPQLTTITVAGVSEGLCGPFRPGPFPGRRHRRLQAPDDGDARSRLFRREGLPAAPGAEAHGARPRPAGRDRRHADGARARRPRHVVSQPATSRRTSVARRWRCIARWSKVADAVRDGRTPCHQAADEAAGGLLKAGFDKVEYLTVVDARAWSRSTGSPGRPASPWRRASAALG